MTVYPGFDPVIASSVLTHLSLDQFPLLAQFMFGLTLFLAVPLVSKRLGIPGVVGLILAGIAIGRSGLNMMPHEGTFLHLFADVGKLLILFFAGLEVNLEEFRKHLRGASFYCVMTFVLPIVGGWALGRAMGYGTLGSLLLGSLLASQSMLCFPIIERLGLLTRASVMGVIGATLFTDFASLMMLEICVSIHRQGMSWPHLGLQIAQVIAYSFVVLVVVQRVARMVVAKLAHNEDMQMLLMLVVVSTSALCAELFHMEQIVGAFLAGIAANTALRQTEAKEHIELLGNALFVPAFFFAIGLTLDLQAMLSSAREHWMLFAGLTVVLAVSKWIAARVTGLVLRQPTDEWKLVWALSLPQVAATLAATMVGYEALDAAGIRLLDEPAVHAVLVMVLLTCIAGPVLAQRYGLRLIHQTGPAAPDLPH